MVTTKGMDRTREKWRRRVEGAGPDYEAGVQNPRRDWQQETAAAEQRYEQGIQESIRDKRFGAGVRRVSTSDWQAAAARKGASRWPEGVRLAEDKYAQNFGPIMDAMERVQLPERGPKGDPKNLQRVAAVNKAARDAARARRGQRGGGGRQ